MKIWDRSIKCYIEEDEYQKEALNFLYHTILGRVLLKLIFSTRWYANLTAMKQHSKKSIRKIAPFIKKYYIDVSQYKKDHYDSFNDFFIREKKEYHTEAKAWELPAIAESRLSVYPILQDTVLAIKRSRYETKDLLEDEQIAQDYAGGTCLVFRLAVEDYHRYVFLDEGEVIGQKAILGSLHTIRPVSEKYKVFSRNSRVWSLLETKHFGQVIQIEVGALQVGKIRNYENKTFNRLQEKGYFEYGGSTIILLFQKHKVKVNEDIWEQSRQGIETKVRIGEVIGENVRETKNLF